MNSEEQIREALRQMLGATLMHITLEHDGPFVVIEKRGGTVVGPFDSIPDALQGLEKWRTEFDVDDVPPDLHVEPLWAPEVLAR